ncbi:unnamed protein product, partial [Ceratitis capitata]
ISTELDKGTTGSPEFHELRESETIHELGVEREATRRQARENKASIQKQNK